MAPTEPARDDVFLPGGQICMECISEPALKVLGEALKLAGDTRWDSVRSPHIFMGLLAVPEPSVIDTGRMKVVYRESLPNTFEGVVVELGSRMIGPGGATYYPILSGLKEGDTVVTAGSFLIDAETRLNPALGSIYIGGSGGKSGAGSSTVRPTTPDDEEMKIAAALASLSPDDRKLAEAQRFCPILDGSRLGSMGVPLKVVLDGLPAFVCCKGCVKPALAEPKATLEKVKRFQSQVSK